uniref:FAD-dependent oxidoreductase n=1 Tax=Muribaculaceae bacterium Z82 TaxID=2304548 RepID=A0A7C9JCD8_9BACT
MALSKKTSEGMNRRDFLKGTMAAGIVGATGALMAGCSPASPTGTASEQPVSASGEETAARASLTYDQVHGGTWSFMVPPEVPSEDKIVRTEEADIVVVGSGTAGLVTAASAVENGAKVILFSASKGNVSRGGSCHGVWSKVMEREGIKRYNPGDFFRGQMIAAGYNVDQGKWWKFANNSEEAMNWCIDIIDEAGYRTVLEASPQLDESDPMFCPVASHSWIGGDITSAGSGQQLLVDTLAARAQQMGATLEYEMVAEQLEKDASGRVVAVLAHPVGSTDEYVRYKASKGIVLATGDFSADKDMMQCYCPGVFDLLNPDADKNEYDVGFTWGGLYRGEGQKMGLWAGAAWQRTYPNAPMTLAVGTSGPANRTMGAHRGLLLNKRGERYGNEDVNGVFAGLTQRHQPEGLSYAIWGTNYAEDAAPWYSTGMIEGESEPMPPAEMIKQWDEGMIGALPQTVVKADTIEEVIEGLGLPKDVALASVNRYNELCAKGVDEDFHKCQEQLIGITEGPFYGAVGGRPEFLTVLGGLRTNLNMQVCDEDDNPIPGLFNVGTMVGDYYGNTYNFMVEGNNLGATCITFGYLTGRDLAKGLFD